MLRPLEVKAETSNLEKGIKLCGGAAFGIETYEKFNEFLDADQMYYGSGWTEHGLLVYLIEVEFNKTKMPDQILEHIDKIYEGSGGRPKTNFHCWKDSDFKVLYLKNRYFHKMTGPFVKMFVNKVYNK